MRAARFTAGRFALPVQALLCVIPARLTWGRVETILVGSVLRGRVMAKIKKSAVELAYMIRSRLNKPKLRVAVYADANGWHATVYAESGAARDLQRRVDQATRELNAHYDLVT